MNTESPLTPMMQQYQRIKAQLPENTLLAFRLGDFYEFFFDDARQAAQLLNITLTNRRDVAMAGIPCHAAHNYFSRLVLAGWKVAICDVLNKPEVMQGKPAIRGVAENFVL